MRTSTKLPMDFVVVEAEAAWDCGGCCGEAAVGGFNENSKPFVTINSLHTSTSFTTSKPITRCVNLYLITCKVLGFAN